METWHFVVGLITLFVAVGSGVVGATWHFAWQIATMEKSLMAQITVVNNSMLVRVQLVEDTLEGKLLAVMQEFSNYKVYCEREFVSKETFNLSFERQSSERNVLKADLMGRLNRIEEKIDGNHRH